MAKCITKSEEKEAILCNGSNVAECKQFLRDRFVADFTKEDEQFLIFKRYDSNQLALLGCSDLDGNLYEKQVITSHKNVAQTVQYNRKITSVPAVAEQ